MNTENQNRIKELKEIALRNIKIHLNSNCNGFNTKGLTINDFENTQEIINNLSKTEQLEFKNLNGVALKWI